MKERNEVQTGSNALKRVLDAGLALSFLCLLAVSMVTPIGAAPVKTSLSVRSSPNPAATTDTIVISGKIGAGNQPVPSQTVEVQYSTDAKKWFNVVVTTSKTKIKTDLSPLTTGPDGSFSVNWKSPGQGQFFLKATFSGNKQYSSSTSNVISQQVKERDKGIIIDTAVILKGLPSPTLPDLKQSGFTLVGTAIYDKWGLQDFSTGSSDWNTVAAWVKSAHGAGLRTFLSIGINLDQKTASKSAIDWTKRAASIGTDVVHLDEILAHYNITSGELRSIIEAGLSVNPKLQYIVSEYAAQYLTAAYDWTAKYPSVRVASGAYNNKGIIDLDVQLGLKYHKSSLVWLIFAKGTQDFDCYLHLDSWIAYVKQKNVDAMFWFIDVEGTWQAQWQQVASF